MMISAFHFGHLIDKLPTKIYNYYYNEMKRLVKLVETTKCRGPLFDFCPNYLKDWRHLPIFTII